MQVMNRGVACDVHMHVCVNIYSGTQKSEITSEFNSFNAIISITNVIIIIPI